MEVMDDVDLVIRAQEGDAEAAHVLMARHKGLLRWLVNRGWKTEQSLSRDESDSSAAFAALKAIMNYDITRGTSFVSYLRTCIETQLKHDRVHAMYPHIAVPTRTLQLAQALQYGYEQQADRHAWARAQEFLDLNFVSIDAPLGEGSTASIVDTVEGVGDEYDIDYARVEAAISLLPPQQRQVLGLMLGDYTVAEAARMMGVSRQRADQCHKLAILNLRDILGVDCE